MGTQIIRGFPRGMPTPNSNQTLIAKGINNPGSSYTTLHTVTTGKTFYLMGIEVHSDPSNTTQAYISLDGGTTNNFQIGTKMPTTTGLAQTIISPGYPIGSAASAANIQVRFTASSTSNGITIWGWEE